jgi:hypothetical protein
VPDDDLVDVRLGNFFGDLVLLGGAEEVVEERHVERAPRRIR